MPSNLTQASGDIGGAMTPMIDVVFLLLIYFLCTASFVVADRFLPTMLPPTGDSAYTPPKEIQELELIYIVLRQDHDQVGMELNGNAIADLAALRERLRQLLALASLPAVLDVGAEVDLGNVIAVYDTCVIAGVQGINFATPER